MSLNEHIENAAKGVSAATYSISGGLVLGDLLTVLDNHAASFGVILGAMTFMTNFIFQLLNHLAIRAKSKRDD